MNALDATRKWLREECPLIDKTDKFNANYLGSQATEYTLCTAGESHREDILGMDHATHQLTFVAQLPYGAAIKANIAAADFFANLAAWIRGANRAHNYPVIAGYEVEGIETPTPVSRLGRTPMRHGIKFKSRSTRRSWKYENRTKIHGPLPERELHQR